MNQEILYICEGATAEFSARTLQSDVHMHDHPELSIILGGEANYTINGKPFTLKRGELVLFNSEVSHGAFLPAQTNYKDLHIGYSKLTDSLYDYFENKNQNFIILKLGTEKKAFYALCEELLREYRDRKKDYKAMINSLAIQLLVLITREYSKEGTILYTQNLSSMGYPDKHKVVEFITSYIDQNYMNDISLEMFAKDMYLSQVYISKIFKEETGSSPINYLIKTRLSKAKEILENEDLPIKVVSGRVGYDDAYHFSKLFKKYYGYAPSVVKRK